MSEIELNPMFLRMRKSMGGIVIYEKNGKLMARVKGRRKTPPTEAQAEVSSAFSRVASYWEPMQGILQLSWFSSGNKKKMNGYNLFIRENFSKERDGEPITLAKSFGDIDKPVISAAPGGSGEIVVSYSISPSETGMKLHLFIKKRTDGLSSGDLIRYSVNRESVSPYTISKLEPGSEYFIYAVLTDWDYSASTQVSASAGITAQAGF